MQPISEFQEQLFQNAGAELSRITTFSCGHVIPPENILPIVLCSGPSGRQLDFSFQTRNTPVLVTLTVDYSINNFISLDCPCIS